MAAVLRSCLLLALVLFFMARSTATATKTNMISAKTTQQFHCDFDVISSSLAQWTTPNFGVEDYPNSFSCSLQMMSDAPFWARITFNAFELESRSSSGNCYDYVRISTPHDFPNNEYCGVQTGTIIDLPSQNFDAFFYADFSITAAGFNISISRETSNCHKLIEVPAIIGSFGILNPPKKANNIWETKACEWWIRSPPGTKIQLEFLKMKLSSDCQNSSVIVNTAGDNQYPVDSSGRHCGEDEPAPVVSIDNEIDILFFAKDSKDMFWAEWTVV